VEQPQGQVSGKEHPDTLTSMNDVAGALSGQGKYAEAEKMHRETLALREHPDMLAGGETSGRAMGSQGI
jgi:hypothetical protein